MSSKRVRTLLRVSSKQQLHDDDIPIQRAEVADYIAKRSDWVFDCEYIEKAISAYKNGIEDRKVLRQILEDAKEHQFDILLTYMSDRIGRQEEYSFYVSELNQCGIEVWTIKDGQLKTEEHVDKLINYIRFWQNEGESKKTSMRVRDTQKELVKAGKFVGGKAPFGYELVHTGEISNHGRLLKRPVIVEEKAEIVRRIYSLAVYQGMGYEKIAKTLNEEGIPAINTTKWKSGTIASILKNPIYMGYPCINRRVNHGSCTRLDRSEWIYSEKQQEDLVIVSPQLWEKAQEIREARKARINASKESSIKLYEEQSNIPFSSKGKLALIGMAYCGYCGKRLKNGSYLNRWTPKKTGIEKVSYVGRYHCPEKCEGRSCYSQDYLEGIVFDVIGTYMEHLKTIDVAEELGKVYSQQEKSVEKEWKQIQNQQKKLKQDIETLEEHIPEALRGDYYFTAEKLASIIKEKEQAIKEAENKIREIKVTLEETKAKRADMEQFIIKVPNWREEFENANVQTKQMLLTTMIDRIEVTNENINIKFKIRFDDFMLESEKLPKTIDFDKESSRELGLLESEILPKTIDCGVSGKRL